MVTFYCIFWLFHIFVTAIWADDEVYDPRGPCGPCFVDASAVSVFYWVAETLTFTGYSPVTTTFTFANTTFAQENIYSFAECERTSVKLEEAVVESSSLNDRNFQRGAYTTVVGDDLFYVVSSAVETGTRTDTIRATGIILSSATAYLAFTSIDVYAEAEGSRGADGKVTCQPRTSFPVLIEPPIFVSNPSENYGAAASYGPEPLPTALVQLLQADASLLQRHPELSSCGTGVVQGAPYALVPITANSNTSTVAKCFTPGIGNAGDAGNGPQETKGVGNLLVPPVTGAYVPPTPRQFAAQKLVPTPLPAPQNLPVQTPTQQPESMPTPVAPVVNTATSQPGSEIPPADRSTVAEVTTRVAIPAGASVADAGSPITLTLPSETVTGIVVSAEASSVVLSVPTDSVTASSTAPVEFVGTASKENGIMVSLVAGLALLIGLFGRL